MNSLRASLQKLKTITKHLCNQLHKCFYFTPPLVYTAEFLPQAKRNTNNAERILLQRASAQHTIVIKGMLCRGVSVFYYMLLILY